MFKQKIKKLKKCIIITLIIVSIILTGCSGNKSVQSQSGGMGIITGKVQITAHNKITGQSLKQLKIKSGNYTVSPSSIKQTISNPEEYIVKFKRNITASYIEQNILKNKGKVINKITDNNLFNIKKRKEGLIKLLQKNPLVESVEPNHRVYIQNIPDDPKFSQQWNLKILNLKKTWKKNKGNNSVTVAVLDTGILTKHPDLKGNLTSGYDFIDNDNDPTDTSATFSHGTHVAGIIGALTDNSQGIAGINWQVKIMPVRVIGPAGNGGYDKLISGIRWATDNGADIINMSLGGAYSHSSLQETIQYAVNNGVTVIAAAGNEGSTPILYPARYPETISVGAIGPGKKRSYYSNYGSELDLVAPGGDIKDNTLIYPQNQILSTAGPEQKYAWKQGTSMATPHVSGLVALLYSEGINNPEQIKTLLKKTADDLGVTGTDKKYGAGLININRALNIDKSNLPDIETDNSNRSSEKKININNIKIFVIKNSTKKLEPITTIIHPQNNGNFNLKTPAGTWSIVAWLDINENNKSDSGDFYDQKNNINVKSNQKTDHIKLELNIIK